MRSGSRRPCPTTRLGRTVLGTKWLVVAGRLVLAVVCTAPAAGLGDVQREDSAA
ncbi:hypothetical protein AB0P17_08250 [Streptomyces sp. NPDC088124]|uniref:hypothetical protein n=1 Tax=Streptomyces sp. NPDC088124 TaxID=3154654 RepID=UPI0034193757